jgi:cysteine desulfurase
MIYFDNNGTTFMGKDAIKHMTGLINIGNPSSCPKAKKVLKEAKEKVKELLCAPNYNIIFTSGATESNCMMIRMVAEKFTCPHIIISSIEHSSVMDLIKIMTKKNQISATLISPASNGIIDPMEVNKAIKSNTKLVCIMYANNELGSINDIRTIGKICVERSVPFFTDATQYLGKFPIYPNKMQIDAFSFSFHKCHGPVGCGMLVIHKNFVEQYKFEAIIAGEQNHHLRGGTENVSSIATSVYCLEKMLEDRPIKNAYLWSLVEYLRIRLSEIAPMMWLQDFNLLTHGKSPKIVLLGPKENYLRLPNTQMFAYYEPPSVIVPADTNIPVVAKFCNLRFKKYMKKRNIFISTGSACIKNASSYVVKQITQIPEIRRGSIRVSFAHYNTKKEIDTFINEFKQFIKNPLNNYMHTKM